MIYISIYVYKPHSQELIASSLRRLDILSFEKIQDLVYDIKYF